MHGQLAVMFPGQGVVDAGAIRHYQSTCPELVTMLAEADCVGRRICNLGLFDDDLVLRDSPPALNLVIYVASLAAHTRLLQIGLGAHVLVGHGFGEIAALVAAGAFSVAEGAEIVTQRFMCLSAADGQGMASIDASSATVTALMQLFEDGALSIAAENSSRNTVIVGSDRALAGAASLARSLGIPVRRLKTASIPHRPNVDRTEAVMRNRLGHICQGRLERVVFSPLLQRAYQDSDDLIGCLARQVVEPLRFADAVRQLDLLAVTPFIECGPLRGLASQLDCPAVTDEEFSRQLLANGSKHVPRSRQREAFGLEVA